MTKEEMMKAFGRDDMIYQMKEINGIMMGVYVPPSESILTQSAKTTKEQSSKKKPRNGSRKGCERG